MTLLHLSVPIRQSHVTVLHLLVPIRQSHVTLLHLSVAVRQSHDSIPFVSSYKLCLMSACEHLVHN